MGRGPRLADDPPMKEPLDLVAVVDRQEEQGLVGASSPAAIDECEREQEVPFDLAGAVGVDVGDEVKLCAGEPIAVVSGGKKIGTLIGSANRAMQSCNDFGYQMSGVVASLDTRHGNGLIVVSGERR